MVRTTSITGVFTPAGRPSSGIYLHGPAALQVLEHRHFMANCRGSCRQTPVGPFGCEVNAVCFFYRLRLRHHCLAECAQAGACRDAVECRTSESADRTKTNIAPELEPDIPADILTDHRVEASTGQNLAESLHAAGQTPIGFPQCK